MKWEYKTSRVGPLSGRGFESVEFDAFINQYGEQGWELVSTAAITGQSLPYPITTEIMLIFKRPKSLASKGEESPGKI